MDDNAKVVKHIYNRFNARDIDGVLAVLADNVAWANGMDGGHVHGLEGVREYWIRQWTMVSPHVEPLTFTEHAADSSVAVEVRQTVRTLNGEPLEDQLHGLKNKTVMHVFRFKDGKVIRFDIRNAP